MDKFKALKEKFPKKSNEQIRDAIKEANYVVGCSTDGRIKDRTQKEFDQACYFLGEE